MLKRMELRLSQIYLLPQETILSPTHSSILIRCWLVDALVAWRFDFSSLKMSDEDVLQNIIQGLVLSRFKFHPNLLECQRTGTVRQSGSMWRILNDFDLSRTSSSPEDSLCVFILQEGTEQWWKKDPALSFGSNSSQQKFLRKQNSHNLLDRNHLLRWPWLSEVNNATWHAKKPVQQDQIMFDFAFPIHKKLL